ncbi:hypothetical protein G647_01243 [Cladophialophora carrionii CBS 160.54]|uniref:Uncharacterized protein n=1 Tax=Cladophialophora carrionii CBS 160.54 TaxID=1279043 RepID=V9DS64_9EURO|nr:uncharacterized protein G647_01243 [Cladophialophora carrionii CBS 160.54]ETI28792.1 hypothetical protein G647_01243 [Cladophialophora carrionii CBS 160.54]
MSASSGNNGVKNLRAMFENKAGDQSTSPPSRGRSPNPSEFSNSSRPVSKVRASFVAVEKPGENGGPALIGLRRASEVSSMGGIQENAIVDNESMEKPSVTTDTDTALKDVTADEPESRLPVDSAPEEGGLGNILKGSAFVENTPSKPPANVTNLGHAVALGRLQQKTPLSSPSKPKNESNSATMVDKMQASKENKPGPPPNTTLKTTETAQPIKAPPTRQINSKIVPKSPIVTQPSPRTPTSPKMNIKGGPAKIRGVMGSAKEAQKAREAPKDTKDKQEKSQPPAPKVNTQAKSRPAPIAAKKEQTPASPKSVRSPTIAKPKPPTIPGKLPAAATATTASAAAKHDDAQRPATEPERKHDVKKTAPPTSRPPRASTSSTTGTLAKKASRASLTNGHQRPQSRVSTSRPDEGFLARMMRPTASSAQKAHDKVQPTSPPKTRGKTMLPPKTKPTTKQEQPPKMHLDTPKEPDTEDKENHDGRQQEQDQNTLPEVAPPSSSDTAKPDAMNADAETEAVVSEPAPSAEQDRVSGEAQEVY